MMRKTYSEWRRDQDWISETPDKMSPEWKQKWVEALRSGRFIQGKGALASYPVEFDDPDGDQFDDTSFTRLSDTEFCCLGVLCDIYDPAEWHGYTLADSGRMAVYWGDSENFIPDGPGIFSLSQGVQDYLAYCNDDGTTFAEIADWIEENL